MHPQTGSVNILRLYESSGHKFHVLDRDNAGSAGGRRETSTDKSVGYNRMALKNLLAYSNTEHAWMIR
jgi:hypothetical protein